MEERFCDNNFDFDIGYLVKSPCKNCMTRDSLPDCIEGCDIIDKIQTVLVDSIPSGTSISPVETYVVPAEILEQI